MNSASNTALYKAQDLWHHVFCDERGVLAICHTDGPEFRTHYFDYPTAADSAADWILEKAQEGRETYFCAHLLTERRRIKENATQVHALWGDLDGAAVPEGKNSPTAIIESSPGRYHCYWRLADPIPPQAAELLNKRLALEIGADPSGFDLTQLLRVPGTANYKYEECPVVVVQYLDADNTYSAGELDRTLQPLPEAPSQAKPNHTHEPAQNEPPVVLGPAALKVWRGEKPKRKEGGGIDRSGSLVHVGRVLYDAGATRPAIVAALAERDETLGWRKYTGRRDADSRYHEIMDELESNGRNGRVRVTVGGNGSEARSAPSFNLTDLGNSQRLIAHHGQDVRYCYPWGSWLVYDGRRYAVDESGEIHRRAKQTVKGIYREASAATDEETRKALAKHAMRSEGENRIQAMISLAKSEAPVMPAELDASVWLLNVLNGTIDLRTGRLLEHRREDLITKLAPVQYDPEASAPVWQATLERVLPSEEVRAFFKRLCGYAISGDVSEHVLPVLYGTGANGKSTILNALLEAAGEYGMQAAPDLLIAKRSGHPTEVADLFGMRLVASIEVEDGRRLAEALVKSLTGGDKVRARRMRQDFWQFDPTHTAFLCTNHKPEIRGTDNAIWRRIRLIPFTETIPPAEQDKKLPEKLREELPGILQWCVEGCLEWQREGLKAPDEVRKATGAYRSEMDVIGAFLRDECEVGPDYKASFGAVYDRYAEWCAEGGEKPETRRKFNARLKERGPFTGRRSGTGGSYEWHGLQLLKKQNVEFAGKLKQGSENDYNQLVSNSPSGNSQNNFSSSVTSAEPPHEDQERRIRKLVHEGMSERLAREAVLGKGWVEP